MTVTDRPESADGAQGADGAEVADRPESIDRAGGDVQASVPGPTAGGARRRRHSARWIAGAVVGALLVLAIVLATRPSADASRFQTPLLGHRAPSFSQTSFGGSKVSLRAYRGRYVYLNFFASWCPPCQQEEPDLVGFSFAQSRLSHGAALVSVVYDDTDDAARSFIDQWGARWPTIPDPGGAIAASFGVSNPPTTFLINPRGVVVAAFEGPVTAAQLNQTLGDVGGRGPS